MGNEQKFPDKNPHGVEFVLHSSDKGYMYIVYTPLREI